MDYPLPLRLLYLPKFKSNQNSSLYYTYDVIIFNTDEYNYRYDFSKEKMPPTGSSNSDSPNSKQLGRQKRIEQTVTIASPVSPGQVVTVTSSDQSSSPAVSSISSQITSTDNGQHPSWNEPPHPLTAPTVERLLPIGTTIRPTGKYLYFEKTIDTFYQFIDNSVGPRPAQRILRCEDTYGSPESPLSKMDVLTVSEYS